MQFEGANENAPDRRIADGRVLSAEDALKYKLIDGIGYRDDVYEAMKKIAGEDVAIYRYEEEESFRRFLSGLFSAQSGAHGLSALAERIAPSSEAPRIEYRLH